MITSVSIDKPRPIYTDISTDLCELHNGVMGLIKIIDKLDKNNWHGGFLSPATTTI